MRTILYYLCRYPEPCSILSHEIRTADAKGLLSPIATYAEAISLPYLCVLSQPRVADNRLLLNRGQTASQSSMKPSAYTPLLVSSSSVMSRLAEKLYQVSTFRKVLSWVLMHGYFIKTRRYSGRMLIVFALNVGLSPIQNSSRKCDDFFSP